ncbi:hypothetical protein SprV_0602182900 [Sparganum proliferum]
MWKICKAKLKYPVDFVPAYESAFQFEWSSSPFGVNGLQPIELKAITTTDGREMNCTTDTDLSSRGDFFGGLLPGRTYIVLLIPVNANQDIEMYTETQ